MSTILSTAPIVENKFCRYCLNPIEQPDICDLDQLCEACEDGNAEEAALIELGHRRTREAKVREVLQAATFILECDKEKLFRAITEAIK